MRVAGGKAKGHQLKVPKVRDIRPTQEGVRLAIFNILGDFVEGKKALDLYAGSGSLGIEALSRGTKEVVFVEQNRHACNIIRENLTKAGLGTKGKIVCRSVHQTLLELPPQKFDLVFLDPPYAIGKMDHVFTVLLSHLKKGAVIVYEHAKTTEAPTTPGLRIFDRRMYGETKVTFLTRE